VNQKADRSSDARFSGENLAVFVEIWGIDRPIPYDRNPRKIPKRAIETVARSLQEFGWQQPIVVDSKAVIIAGHTRLLAAKHLGLTQVPVHVAKNLTEAQARAYRLMDNRSSEDSSWELKILAVELGALRAMTVDLAATGFAETEIARLLADPDNEALDAVPAAPAVPTSKRGDLWHLGNHRLLCGDSCDAADVARVLGGQKPTLMVTDPPYGIQLDTEWRDRAGANKMGPAQPSYMKKRIAGHTNTSVSGDTRADWSEAFAHVPSLEVVYVWHASAYTREVLDGLLRIGFTNPQQIIWAKTIAAMTRTHYWYQHEPCWYARKKNAPWFGEPGKNTTVWSAKSPKQIMSGSTEEKFDHPTQKPVELMSISILNHTKPGGLVYEPFGGSGTTLAAAEFHGRTSFTIEIDPQYVDVIVDRWQRLSGRTALFEGGESFDEVKRKRARGRRG